MLKNVYFQRRHSILRHQHNGWGTGEILFMILDGTRIIKSDQICESLDRRPSTAAQLAPRPHALSGGGGPPSRAGALAPGHRRRGPCPKVGLRARRRGLEMLPSDSYTRSVIISEAPSSL